MRRPLLILFQCFSGPHFNSDYRKVFVNGNTLVNLCRNYSMMSQKSCDSKEPPKPFERLPKIVVPKHYDLFLKPDFKTFTFDGRINITIHAKSETNKIVLHSVDLDVKDVTLCKNEGEEIKPKDFSISVEEETLTLEFADAISVGKSNLTINFVGELNDKMKGFYRSKYKNAAGDECFAAVTQFEPTDARRCFPCWDEPAIKSTFDITVECEKHQVVLSNMPLSSCDCKDSSKVVKFKTTPVMPTYLVAVVVGEYDYVESKSDDGVVIRVYTPVGKKDQGLFALEVTTAVLPYYRDYFQIAYPLPKIDLIAIADFSAGAMENWGLVTYRESCLLVDPKNTSASSKQWIAIVVGHELAHMWFGNLVTMEWWTHLWLNEGYASFVEFLCVDHLFPEYDIWTQFVTETYIKALELDCLNNSHPIEVPVGNPSEINEIFDEISYNKGASVIRMLHRYIGDEDFRKGMNIYLTRHQYGNTFTEDLWAALEEASNKPVGAVMSTWTKQMGYPVIKVSEVQDGDNRKLTVTQNKFCADGCNAEDESLWMVPLIFSTSKSPDKIALQTVLESRTSEIVIPNISEDEWVKVNAGTVGFYRTQYPPEMLIKFLPSIRDKSLPPLDRLGLLADLFAMVQAGQSPTVEVLKLMEAFGDEDNYTVWSSLSSCFGKLLILLSHTEFDNLFQAFGRKLMSKVITRLGWDQQDNESHLDTLLRSLVIKRLVSCDESSVIEEAKKRFDLHVKKESILVADLRSPVYKAVLSSGEEDTYKSMLELYKTEELHEEKDRISVALGSIRNKEILLQVLDFAVSDEVRSQDSVFVIVSVAMNKLGRDIAWEFFQKNWKELRDRYDGGFLLSRLVKGTTENFASEEKAKEVEKFFQDHTIPGVERTVQQCLESIRLNAQWLDRDRDSLRDYLSAFK